MTDYQAYCRVYAQAIDACISLGFGGGAVKIDPPLPPRLCKPRLPRSLRTISPRRRDKKMKIKQPKHCDLYF